MKRNRLPLAALAALAALTVHGAAKTALDVPVSSVGNTAYLSSMDGRPWWNAAWTRRAPLLVSSTADAEDRNAIIDAIVDFGEAVNPDEVRLVTPWEEEVPCVAERVRASALDLIPPASGLRSETSVRLLFRTTLRVRENKPFLVYWGNPKATRPTPATALSIRREKGELRILNGKLEVSFDLRRRTPGLIRRLRVLGSQAPTEILMRATDYAWDGFSVALGSGGWTNAALVANNAFVKSVRFHYPGGAVTMSVYDEQPRVDWSYELREGNATQIGLSWACGGDVGFDRIVYPGLAGRGLSVKAALDSATDCIPMPSYDFTPYLSEGWYAIQDRRVNDVVGMVFDRGTLAKLAEDGNGQAYGVMMTHKFAHRPRKPGEPPPTGSGALVATVGRWQDVRDEYRRFAAKPLVLAGRPEGVREIPVTHPRLDRDWVFSIDANGWCATQELEGTEWATNAACHLRALGANVSRSGPGWAGLPVPRELYASVTNRLAAPGRSFPKWGEDGNFTGRKFTERCAAAHAKGVSVSIWGGFCPVGGTFDRTDPDAIRFDIELQNLYPKCGMDCVYNAAAQGEGPGAVLSPALKKANGGENWRRWKDADAFFRAQDENTERVKSFYREAKRRNPGVPVVLWNAENSEVTREMFMGDQAGYFDTCMVEILPNRDFIHVKNVVKRMRALFDNGAGRTVHHHYYFYGTDRQDFAERINQVEMPFACGCNGFSLESLTYEHYDRDATEIPGDFARLAEYTRLGEKAARMAPVKNLAVLRDGAMYRYCIRHNLCGEKFAWRTYADDRVHNVGRLRNFSFDVVVNRYFTAKDLAKYRVVYIPEDPALSDALAGELLAFVKAGGGALLEGQSLGPKALQALGLRDGEVRAVGRGRILWLDKLPWFDARFRRLVDELGGRNPCDIAAKTLDSVLQASDEGMLLSVVNPGDAPDTGTVTLDADLPILRSARPAFVLDVRHGVRQAFTNGFAVTVGPRQCGFYLIGDAAFTALPPARPGAWAGPSFAAAEPKASVPKARVPTNFTQAVAVEFTRGTAAKPATTRRAAEASVRVIPMTADAYSARRMGEALAEATYLHFVATDTAAADAVFADCADELRALLKRGGGIVFDRMTTGPKARAFLGSVGVYDPNAAAVAVRDDAALNPALPKDSLLRPLDAGWFNQGLAIERGFPKWDEKTQFATHLANHEKHLAMAVAQEKVLGAGRVIFTQNARAFNDFYENMRHGDSILSWVIGRRVAEHAELVRRQNGGIGRVEE